MCSLKDTESPFASISIPESDESQIKKLEEPILFLEILNNDQDPMVFWERSIDEAKFLIDHDKKDEAAELLKQVGREIYTYLQNKKPDEELKKELTEKAFRIVDTVKYLKGISDEAKPIPKFADLDENDEISTYPRSVVIESILNRILSNYTVDSIALVGISGRIIYQSGGSNLFDESLLLQSIYQFKAPNFKISDTEFILKDDTSRGIVYESTNNYLFLIPTGQKRLLVAISPKEIDYNLFLLSVNEELRFI